MLCWSVEAAASDGLAESELMETDPPLLAVLLYSDRLTRFRNDRLDVGFFRKLENLAPFRWSAAEVSRFRSRLLIRYVYHVSY